MLEWKVGDVTITSVAEVDDAAIPGPAMLPDATPDQVLEIDWLRPQFADDDGNVRIRIQALVLQHGDRRIVVDTCLGNDKPRTKPFFDQLHTSFIADLTGAGFAPQSIDTVVCTHLHVDHVGWNTMLRDGEWVPTFPEARYLLSKVDVDYWSTTPSDDGDLFGDSVKPVLDAGLADLVNPPHQVTDAITLVSTPGHSPGHVSVRIQSGGQEAVITGDVMHHPAQCARPGWHSNFDEDVAHARRTRSAFLAEYADRDVLVIGTHFAAPGGGHIVTDGDVYRFSTEQACPR